MYSNDTTTENETNHLPKGETDVEEIDIISTLHDCPYQCREDGLKFGHP